MLDRRRPPCTHGSLQQSSDEAFHLRLIARSLTIALCLLATSALLLVAGCTSSENTAEATCLAHNVTPGTWAYANCVEMVREKGPLILRHVHVGGHQ